MQHNIPALGPSRLVALHAQGSGRPLFIFPGVYGGPETFRDLAQRLDAGRPVYGVTHAGAQRECEPIPDMTRLAQLYAADIQRLQPHGPYYLLGYSLGGVVAFEVARALQTRAERIGLVIMAECLAPGYPRSEPPLRRARIHLQRLLTSSSAERASYVRERWTNARRRIAARFGGANLDDPDFVVPEHIRRVNDALYTAYRQYRPEPQRVDVLFLTAETPSDWPCAIFDDVLLGWSSALQGRIWKCDVPGHHRSIFEPQHLDALMERIRATLAEVDGYQDQRTDAA